MITYVVFVADPDNYGYVLGKVRAVNIAHALTVAHSLFNGPIGVKLLD